jgi:phosphopantetheinyl transferase
MPLYKEWNPNLHSLAAIWHISEPEAFFAEQVPVSANHIAHSKRRIEFLAGRFLLQYLNKDFPLHAILRDEHDKPQLPDREFHFSISHSFPYVACIISTDSAVGIDIQCWHKSILALQRKFLSEQEQLHCENESRKITLAWSIKEAAYKYQGLRGVEFIEHLPILKWEEKDELFDIVIKLQLTSPIENVNVKGLLFNDFALAFAAK